MKIKINKKDTPDIAKLIKHCGYAELSDRKTGQKSFTRRLGPYFYPRFHIYVEEELTNNIFLTLHLDQKQPSYKGCPAHSGEYEGDLIEKEARRIKNYIENETK